MAFIAASSEQQKRQRSLARELRRSQWWKRILAQGRCHHCGANVPASQLTMDHLVPIAQGGQSTKGNVVPSCKQCNTAKGYQSPLEQAFAALEQQRQSKTDL